MSTQPYSLSYLMLDAENDTVFNNATALTGRAAVAQAILTKLNLFLAEWFENLNLGLPVFQVMLGQLGSSRTIQAAQQAVAADIMTLAPYVTSVITVAVAFNDASQLSIQVTAQTVFGVVNVSSAPGASAVIGA
jgi:hypothetical protein